MTYKIKYRSEDEMKDSGIEWLGMIPKSWEIISNKYIANINTGGKDTQDREENGKYPFFVRSETIERINSYSFDGEAILTPGDGDIGGIFHYINGKFDFHQRVYKYSNFKNYNGKYLYYYLKRLLKGKVMGLSAKSTVDSLRLPMLLNFECLYNNLSEQEKIANFLDLKTAEFDSIISKKELLIEKLEEAKKSLISEVVTGKVKIVDGELVERKADEMRDSGVEWLGMIPKDWGVGSLRWYITCRSGDFISNLEVERERFSLHKVPVIGGNGVMGYSENYNTIKDVIAIGRVGALCGNVHLIDYKSWITDNSLIINHNEKEFDIRYLEILLRNLNLNKYSISTAQPLITGETIKNRRVAIPKIKEQQYIIKFISLKTNELITIITKTKLQIEKLKQAKQSLISEAVTGKIDLRDWEIREI